MTSREVDSYVFLQPLSNVKISSLFSFSFPSAASTDTLSSNFTLSIPKSFVMPGEPQIDLDHDSNNDIENLLLQESEVDDDVLEVDTSTATESSKQKTSLSPHTINPDETDIITDDVDEPELSDTRREEPQTIDSFETRTLPRDSPTSYLSDDPPSLDAPITEDDSGLPPGYRSSLVQTVIDQEKHREESFPSFDRSQGDPFAAYLSSSHLGDFLAITADEEVLKEILEKGYGPPPAPLSRVYISVRGIAHFPQQSVQKSNHATLSQDDTKDGEEESFFYDLDLPYYNAVDVSKDKDNTALQEEIVRFTNATLDTNTKSSSARLPHLPVLFTDTGIDEVNFVLGHAVQARGLEVALSAIGEGEKARVICSPKYGYSRVRTPSALVGCPPAVLEFILTVERTENTKNLHEMTLPEKLQYLNSRRNLGKELVQAGKFASAFIQYEKAISVLDDPEVIKVNALRRKVSIMFLQNQAICQFRQGKYAEASALATRVLEDLHDSRNAKALYTRGYSRKAKEELEFAKKDFENLSSLLDNELVRLARIDATENALVQNDGVQNMESIETQEGVIGPRRTIGEKYGCICTGVEFTDEGGAVSCGGSCLSEDNRLKLQREKKATKTKIDREIVLLRKQIADAEKKSLAGRKLRGFFASSSSTNEFGRRKNNATSGTKSTFGKGLYDDKPDIAKSVLAKRDIADAMAFNAGLRDPNNKTTWLGGLWNATKFVAQVYTNYLTVKFKDWVEDEDSLWGKCCSRHHKKK